MNAVLQRTLVTGAFYKHVGLYACIGQRLLSDIHCAGGSQLACHLKPLWRDIRHGDLGYAEGNGELHRQHSMRPSSGNENVVTPLPLRLSACLEADRTLLD